MYPVNGQNIDLLQSECCILLRNCYTTMEQNLFCEYDQLKSKLFISFRYLAHSPVNALNARPYNINLFDIHRTH